MGQVASRLAFIWDAGHVLPNTGHPLKYGTSDNLNPTKAKQCYTIMQ